MYQQELLKMIKTIPNPHETPANARKVHEEFLRLYPKEKKRISEVMVRGFPADGRQKSERTLEFL